METNVFEVSVTTFSYSLITGHLRITDLGDMNQIVVVAP